MAQGTIKVGCAWTVYRDKGLRFPVVAFDEAAGRVLEVGDRVVVFDEALEFTQHDVVSRDAEHVVLGPGA